MGRITCLLICLAVFMFLPCRSSGQEAGFESINCGGSNFSDNSTRIQWINDNALVGHGNNTSEIEASLKNMTSVPLQTLRFFPKDPRNNKFCYSRSVSNNSTHIVRATFLYGNYDGLKRPPSFVLLLNYDVWVPNVNTSMSNQPTVHEIMYVSVQDHVSICLAPHSNDTPFISTLELRLLNPTMPLYKTSTPQSHGGLNLGYGLRLKYRINYGAATSSAIRYPDDKFDRIWVANSSGPILHTSKNKINASYASDPDEPPPAVMATAITAANNHTNLTFEFEDFGGVGGFYVGLHFAELVPGVNVGTFNVDLGAVNGPLTLEQHGAIGTSVRVHFDQDASIRSPYLVTLIPTATVAGPLLNAIELFRWTDKPLSTVWTPDEDLSALHKFQKALNLTGYGDGDPCLPQDYGWTWIVCSNGTPPRIKEINLASFNLSGNIPSSITTLSQLQKIDLSNNNLTGSIPDLHSLVYLEVLDLHNNELSGQVPQSLGLLSKLRQLHLDHNNLCGSIPSFVSKKNLNLTYTENLDLCNETQCTCPNMAYMASSKSNKSVYIYIYSCLAALYILLMIVVLLICKKMIQKVKQRSSIISSSSTKEGIHGIQNILFITKKFSYDELIAATNHFTTKIGEGGFGKVFKGILQSGEVVAVKMLADTSNQGVKEFCTEVAILSRLRHKNLVSLVGYCIETTHMLIYEYISKGNLSALLYGEVESIDKPIRWITRLRIALDASQGLEYLHKGCDPIIIHRDVKSSNILLNDKMEAKVSDFGLSRLKDGDSAMSHVSTVNVLGTVGYLDPAYNATNQLTDKSDVYSFGVVLFELICGRPPIDAFNSPPHIVDWATPAILQGRIGDIVDPGLMNGYKLESMWKVIDVALGCVDSDRSKRPSMSEVVHVLREAAKIETDSTFGSKDVSSSSSTSEGKGPILHYIESLRRELEPR